MSRTEEFISSLEDFELAFLNKYKLDSYMKPTQGKIKSEIDRRDLTEEQLQKLIADLENNPANTGCPRCNSKKIRTDEIDVAKGSGVGGSKIAYLGGALGSGHDLTSKGEKIVCQICGFILKDDDNKESKLIKFFKGLINRVK